MARFVALNPHLRPLTPCRLSLVPLDPAIPLGPVREWRLDFAGGHVCGGHDPVRGPMSREGALHLALDWAVAARYAIDPDSLPVDEASF